MKFKLTPYDEGYILAYYTNPYIPDVNPQKFSSLTELLAALLNHILHNATIFDGEIILPWDKSAISLDSLKTYIEDIFFCKDNRFELSPSECYVAHASADKTLGLFDSHTEFFIDNMYYISLYAFTELGFTLDELKKDIQNKSNTPISDTRAMAFAVRQIVKSYNLKIETDLGHVFYSTNNLVLWLIRTIALSNKKIGICPVCGHYFHLQSNIKYCSPTCKVKNMNSSAFHGQSEIKRYSKRNQTLLNSKEKYFKEKQIPYHIIENDKSIHCDITKIKDKYNSENQLRLDDFHYAFNEMQKNPCRETEEEFKKEADSYLSWLKDQNRFIKTLRQDRYADKHQS